MYQSLVCLFASLYYHLRMLPWSQTHLAIWSANSMSSSVVTGAASVGAASMIRTASKCLHWHACVCQWAINPAGAGGARGAYCEPMPGLGLGEVEGIVGACAEAVKASVLLALVAPHTVEVACTGL